MGPRKRTRGGSASPRPSPAASSRSITARACLTKSAASDADLAVVELERAAQAFQLLPPHLCQALLTHDSGSDSTPRSQRYSEEKIAPFLDDLILPYVSSNLEAKLDAIEWSDPSRPSRLVAHFGSALPSRSRLFSASSSTACGLRSVSIRAPCPCPPRCRSS